MDKNEWLTILPIAWVIDRGRFHAVYFTGFLSMAPDHRPTLGGGIDWLQGMTAFLTIGVHRFVDPQILQRALPEILIYGWTDPPESGDAVTTYLLRNCRAVSCHRRYCDRGGCLCYNARTHARTWRWKPPAICGNGRGRLNRTRGSAMLCSLRCVLPTVWSAYWRASIL